MTREQRCTILHNALVIKRAISEERAVRLDSTVTSEMNDRPNSQEKSTCVNDCDVAKVSAIARKEFTRPDQDVEASTCTVEDQEFAYIQELRTNGRVGVARQGRLVEIGARRAIGEPPQTEKRGDSKERVANEATGKKDSDNQEDGVKKNSQMQVDGS